MYQIDKVSWGAFVARLRREKGWTQKELAERLYVSDKAVSKWETGASLPDTQLLIPLAEQLGVTVTELLPGLAGGPALEMAVCRRAAHRRGGDGGRDLAVLAGGLPALCTARLPYLDLFMHILRGI